MQITWENLQKADFQYIYMYFFYLLLSSTHRTSNRRLCQAGVFHWSSGLVATGGRHWNRSTAVHRRIPGTRSLMMLIGWSMLELKNIWRLLSSTSVMNFDKYSVLRYSYKPAKTLKPGNKTIASLVYVRWGLCQEGHPSSSKHPPYWIGRGPGLKSAVDRNCATVSKGQERKKRKVKCVVTLKLRTMDKVESSLTWCRKTRKLCYVCKKPSEIARLSTGVGVVGS